MKEKNLADLPGWLQTLWNVNPTLAREAEKYLDELGADIRNKLSPPKNLCALLKIKEPDTKVNILIRKEIKNTENSVEYLKNLL